MLTPAANPETLRQQFRWQVPEHYNIGVDCCDRWAGTEPARVAIIDCGADGVAHEVTFAALKAQSDRLALALRRRGVRPGDRVAVLLSQRSETAVAHLSAFRLGAISIPLFTLFGPEALSHRLRDSGAKVVITDAEGAARIAALRGDLPDLTHVLSVDPAPGAEDYAAALAAETGAFTPVTTRADDPALLIYTSGTTGNPKGALHAHRVLLGHLPGVEVSHDFLPQPGDRLWTPADWAWIGGLLDVLMPGLHHGVPVVARRFSRFTPEAAFDLIRAQGIRNVFLPPTALKLMRRVPDAAAQGLGLRTVASGGEPLGEELLDWGRRVLGVEINEFYGQTECNMIVSACGALEPGLPGVMGRPVPGHEVAVIDETGSPCPDGTEGDIAVRRPDPVMFLRYWNAPEATARKFRGDWLLTGDRGARLPDGRLRFVGREDDVITSAGYRIGPAEVENCLLRHPAVRLAGVVGLPDPVRGHVVAAFVTLSDGHAPSDALAEEIAAFVKTRLSAHEYPRIVRFLDEMPMTTTGKIIRARLRQMTA